MTAMANIHHGNTCAMYIFTCHSQAGISKTDSADELTLFFQLLANQLSQSTEEIIKRMKEDEVRINLLLLCVLIQKVSFHKFLCIHYHVH